jgi:hypothetical protein
MRKLIEHNLYYLTQLTKEDADFIEHVLKWDDEQRQAFMLAKRIFEDDLGANKSQAE